MEGIGKTISSNFSLPIAASKFSSRGLGDYTEGQEGGAAGFKGKGKVEEIRSLSLHTGVGNLGPPSCC